MKQPKYLIRFTILFFALATPTCNAKQKLTDFSHNAFSQYGEDGIVAKIFEIIGTTSKICVEFGASDGVAQSNTRKLYTNGWKAILLECESSFWNALVNNTNGYDCLLIPRRIYPTGSNSIESILAENNVNEQIDLMVIDIDGNDYYIFDGLQSIRPRVIMCEYNPTIPATLDIYPPLDNVMGCSVAALQRIAHVKGYSLIALTESNCIFVINEEFSKFENFETSLEHIKIDKHVLYMITDYQSRYAVVGNENFYAPWGTIKTTTIPQLFGKCVRIQ